MADANTSSRISTLRPRNAEGVVVAPLNPPAHLPAHPVQQARQHAMALPQFEVVHPHLAERVLVGPGVPHQGLPQNALAPAQIALALVPAQPTNKRKGRGSIGQDEEPNKRAQLFDINGAVNADRTKERSFLDLKKRRRDWDAQKLIVQALAKKMEVYALEKDIADINLEVTTNLYEVQTGHYKTMQADVNVHREGYGRARIEARQQAAVGAVAQHVPGTIIPVHDLVDGMVAVPLAGGAIAPYEAQAADVVVAAAPGGQVDGAIAPQMHILVDDGAPAEAQADGVAAAAPGGLVGGAVAQIPMLVDDGAPAEAQADGVVAAAPGGQVGVAVATRVRVLVDGGAPADAQVHDVVTQAQTAPLAFVPTQVATAALPAHIPDAASAPRLLDNYHEGGRNIMRIYGHGTRDPQVRLSASASGSGTDTGGGGGSSTDTGSGHSGADSGAGNGEAGPSKTKGNRGGRTNVASNSRRRKSKSKAKSKRKQDEERDSDEESWDSFTLASSDPFDVEG